MNEANKEKFEDLELVKQVMDKLKVPFMLAYGTCLGAYRDKDFLPDDNDIDLVVTEPVSHKTKKQLGWMLYDLGFKNQEIAFNVYDKMEPQEIGYNGDIDNGIICCEKSIKFTIFFFKKVDCPEHGEEMLCSAKLGAKPLISSPAKFYKKMDKIKFGGTEYNLPGKVEEYLTYTYEDWKDPLKRDHGQLFFEVHNDGQQIKDVIKEQRVAMK